MSSIVKNQIAKQLARFTKNLSPNKISVKFLKGEGELHNLELDEKILSDLLELPPWLRITKAVCNKISAKIHWTKLKTDPICLYLDCIQIDMEEVIVMQSKSPSTPTAPQLPPPTKEKAANRYGFVEKVVDGMYVQINSVLVSFKSPGFTASFQMSRLIIQSTTPEWRPDDLRNTRLKDETKGEVLTFKEITWSTLRIDANAQVDEQAENKSTSAPIRLITSQSSLHITIKKRLEDCSVLSACLKLLLDDILWVLSQSQLQALVGFMNSINQAMEQTGPKKEPASGSVPPHQATQQQSHTQYTSSNIQNGPDKESSGTVFSKYDLLETSYHLGTGQIDLHLCDDSIIQDKQSKGSNGVDPLAGGAMQMRINKLALDYYPYHLAGTSRTSWECHNEASLSRAYWVNQLLNTFRNTIRNRKNPNETGPPRQAGAKTNGATVVDGQPHPPSSPTHPQGSTSPKPPRPPLPKSPQHQHIPQTQGQRRPVFMYESCCLIRCDEFFIMAVTTFTAPGEGSAFLSSDKKALYLPSDMPAFQIDYTQYYYPGGIVSPVPPPNLFVQLNPIQLTLDTITCIWFNRFLRSIFSGEGLMSCRKQQQPAEPSHVDIRIEALMPKIILPCPSDPCSLYRESRPQALQIQMSQVFFTNSRIGSHTSQTELLMLLQHFSSSKLYADFGSFPNDMDDIRPLPNIAWLKDFGLMEDSVKTERLLNGIQSGSHRNCRPSQVWCMSADQCWADFLGIASNKDRPMPFIDSTPLRLWICTPLPSTTSNTIAPKTGAPIPQLNNQSSVESNLTVNQSNTSENMKNKLSRKAYEPLEQNKFSEPHSAASSPGCKRTNGMLMPAPLFTSNSSPNLKESFPLKENLRSVDSRTPSSDSTSGIEFDAPENGMCHSLPASPRSQASRFGQITNASANSIPSDKSEQGDSLSLSSQPCSSSSQEDFVMIENAGHERSINSDYRIPTSDIASMPRYGIELSTETYLSHEANSLRSSPNQETNDTPCLPRSAGSGLTFANEQLNEFGLELPQKEPLQSRRLTHDGPNTLDEGPQAVRKAFGYFSSAEDENLSDDHMDPPKVADLSIVASIPSNVILQLDHFQFIFLMRLQEMIVKLQEELGHEGLKCCSESNDTATATGSSITFSLLARKAEVSIILPPSPEPTPSTSRGASSMSSYLDPGFVSDGGSGSPEIGNEPLDNVDKKHPLPDVVAVPGKEDNSTIQANLPPKSPGYPIDESLTVCDVISGADICGRVSTASIPDADGWMPPDVGKGLGINTHNRCDSDLSCESSQLGTSVESSAKSSARGVRSERLVSIFTAEGTDIHLGIHMDGMDTSVKVIAQELKVDEKGNCNIEKYLNQKSFKSPRENKPLPVSFSATPPMLSMRAEFGPRAERNAPSAGERGFAHVQLSSLAASLLMSNMEGLGDCFEDEVVIPGMPLYIELKHSSVSIRDDKPPRLLSAPLPIPINVDIENLTIFRNHDGVFNIRAINTSSADIRGVATCSTVVGGSFRGESPRRMSRQLSRTASDLSLAESVSSRSDNYDSERECLKAQLSVSRTALHSVQEERQALLKTIERLQQELSMSNREQDHLQLKLMAYQTGGTPTRKRSQR